MSDFDLSKFDLKSLAEPVSKLIDTVRSSVGIAYEPIRIVLQAKADAKAELILTAAEIEKQDMLTRAAIRINNREQRRQRNIESVLKIGVNELPEAVDKNPVDEDWVSSFFEQCQDVGNEQMQTIWGRILAGEVARPGSYSPGTLAVVKLMRHADAELFTKFCRFTWYILGRAVPAIPWRLPVEGDYSVASNESLSKLSKLGLIEHQPEGGIGMAPKPPKQTFPASYFNKKFTFSFNEGFGQKIRIGRAFYTDAGLELLTIAGGEPDDESMKMMIDEWRNGGMTIVEQPQ